MKVDKHSWVVKDYQIIDGKMYEIDLILIIDNDRVLEKELKRKFLYKVSYDKEQGNE